MTGKVPTLPTNELPLEDETIATDQGAIPLPYFAGTRKLAVRWLGPAYNLITKEAAQTGGKKGSKASSKGGSGSKSYDYFGTIFAGISLGPLDKLHAVIAGGTAVWENTSGLARSGVATDLTGSIESKYFTQSGYLKILWGTDAQTADAVETAQGHPALPNVARLVGKNLLFGTENTTAPNLEVIAARVPVCSTDLCAADKNVLDDGQVNPVAVLAEMLTGRIGLGWDAARLDATSWAAAGSYCYTNRATCFGSFLFADYGDLRTAAAAVLQHFDGALAWTTTGTLALKLLKYGTDPGGLTTLDANHFTAPPRLTLGGWGEVPTGVVLRYVDRDRKFKEADEKLDNLVALHVRGEDDRRSLAFPHVTRRDQILALAAQAVRRLVNPPASAELVVRRAFADKFPGDKLKVDVDPEPGGAGTAQLAVVAERRDDGRGPIKLGVKFDPIAESAPYTPGFTPTEPQDAEVDPIVYALALPMPGPAVAIVAARPQEDCVGFRVLFAVVNSSDDKFSDLGSQPGFAVRCSLDVTVTADDDELRLSLLDGSAGPDAYLAARTAGTPEEAAQDILLAVLADVDGNGRVTFDADGLPNLEFCSVISRAAVDSDTHDYTVIRGRKGQPPRDWATGGGTKAWLIPGASLLNWQHEYMADLLASGDVGYVRLAAITNYTEDLTLPEFEFTFPVSYNIAPTIAWTTPATDPFELGADGDLTPDADLTDGDSNLIRIELFSTDPDGVITTHLEQLRAATGATTLQDVLAAAGFGTSGSISINLGAQTSADQYFTLTLRIRDASGNITDSSRTLIIPGGSGVGLGGVAFEVTNLHPFRVELTVGGTATKIHYAWLALGSAAPVSWTNVNATSQELMGRDNRRLWARASDGTNHSAWQYKDY